MCAVAYAFPHQKQKVRINESCIVEFLSMGEAGSLSLPFTKNQGEIRV